ncbi:N-acetyllactosaminide beta-1,6-N-acetylglucosaminyl-transferase-like isoform X2 [Tigriopus californicus]|nr:N-acetyllactosaminide beta-1,6-N-acetylglucosaminyl-transferase-like isoform X2 [Tigriopus californicus]
MNHFSSKKSRFSEKNTFPLAFAISAHFQVGILELFLATSFDPLDSYCIHVDAKADEKVTKAVDQMVKCYQWKHPKATIFTVDDPISVFWGHFSVLEADLKCMQLLRTRNTHWNLLINPAGTELPLKPMPEIRKYLEKFPNGIIDSFPLPEGNKGRFVVSKENENNTKTDQVKESPPGNIVMRKGSKNVALSRELVDFFLDDPSSKGLQEWLQDKSVPDEHFYSTIITLINNGTQDLNSDSTYGGCVRLSWWGDNNCKGENVRAVCNFGLQDLPRLYQDGNCLFANKFNLDVDSIAPLFHALYLLNS